MMELQQSCMFQLAAQVVVSTCISFKGGALIFTSLPQTHTSFSDFSILPLFPFIVWRNCLLVVGIQKNDFSFPSFSFFCVYVFILSNKRLSWYCTKLTKACVAIQDESVKKLMSDSS